jgi:hypothetical protein
MSVLKQATAIIFAGALVLTPAAIFAAPTANLTVTVVPAPTSGGGTHCDIGPDIIGDLPAPAVAAGYTTCAANYDFSTTNDFTVNGNTYNFSNIATWLGCNGQSTALWWPSSYNSPGTAPCSDFNIINDSSIGKNVLEMAFTNADGNNGVSATTMSLGNGGWGGGTPAQTNNFPQGIYLQFALQILPSDVNPYAGVPDCAQGQPGGTYCEEFGFFSLNTAGPFNEWDFIESDTGYSGNGAFAYSGGNFLWNGGSPAPNNEFSYHDYGVLLTTDGATGIAKCTYIDGVHTTTGNQGASPTGCYEHWDGGSAGFQYSQRQFWGLMLGAQEFQQCYFGGPCAAPNVTQHMRVQYIRVFSCANWASGQCNTGIKLTP